MRLCCLKIQAHPTLWKEKTMNGIGKYFIAAIAMAAFVMTAASPSLAALDKKNSFALHKKAEIQRKSTLRPAHRIVNNGKKRKNDFSNLNQ